MTCENIPLPATICQGGYAPLLGGRAGERQQQNGGRDTRGRAFSLFDCMTATSTLLALSSLHEGGGVVRAAGRRGVIPCIVPQACLISRSILATLPSGPGHCSVGKRGARPCLPTPGRPGVMPVPEQSRRARREGRIAAGRQPARPLLPIDYARRRSYSFCSLVSCIRFIRLEMAACG
jgi:hypothetical protein